MGGGWVERLDKWVVRLCGGWEYVGGREMGWMKKTGSDGEKWGKNGWVRKLGEWCGMGVNWKK